MLNDENWPEVWSLIEWCMSNGMCLNKLQQTQILSNSPLLLSDSPRILSTLVHADSRRVINKGQFHFHLFCLSLSGPFGLKALRVYHNSFHYLSYYHTGNSYSSKPTTSISLYQRLYVQFVLIAYITFILTLCIPEHPATSASQYHISQFLVNFTVCHTYNAYPSATRSLLVIVSHLTAPIHSHCLFHQHTVSKHGPLSFDNSINSHPFDQFVISVILRQPIQA